MFRCAKPSSLPVAGLTLAMYGVAWLPLIQVNFPPTRMCPRTPSSVSTSPPAVLVPKPETTLPVDVLIFAMSLTAVPPTEVKSPPI